MARTVSGRKSAAKKAAVKKAAPKASAKAAVTKKAAQSAPARKSAVKKTAGRVRAAPKKAAPVKAAAKKAVPKKTGSAKKAPAKKPVARIPATRPPPVRRTRSAAAPRPKSAAAAPRAKASAARLKTAAPAQQFTVSHLNEADFKADGLRAYAQYRDLGIAAATGGLCQAHVIRLVPPCTDEVRQRHVHETELQLIYVLKGWIKNEFEGHGVQMMSAGTCWLQPPGIKHTVLDYSADVEMLEIIVPADFQTRDVD